jgi:hypothetical protein
MDGFLKLLLRDDLLSDERLTKEVLLLFSHRSALLRLEYTSPPQKKSTKKGQKFMRAAMLQR